ncbi:hypothetical protein CB0940_09477 [Cercospora beticola]|uniref:Exonuclease domain-containing protein n=1 Tax=Cercospora beticola TaxID=122368 RepID=A0A2G5HI48_CERBT|nr:hypothetical protein CB0940_09477 [Cercospora beticola]PIA92244.1 hypothetical protein CB0940_09477 [Cercospora beticola]WPB06205.1 hypothetical protein RHO25_010862 [Cercospora beticola]
MSSSKQSGPTKASSVTKAAAKPSSSQSKPHFNPLSESTNIKDHMRKRDPPYCRATQVQPAFHLLRDDEAVAFDVEFQRICKNPTEKRKVWQSRLGWFSVVGEAGQEIFNCFVFYDNEPGTEKAMDPIRFGVLREDLKAHNGARNGREVEATLRRIFQGRKVIMHDRRGDMKAFYTISDAFDQSEIVDTQQLYRHLQPESGQPGLRDTALKVLGRVIQAGGLHNPSEDARATMDLWLEHRRQADTQAEDAKDAGLLIAETSAEEGDSAKELIPSSGDGICSGKSERRISRELCRHRSV